MAAAINLDTNAMDWDEQPSGLRIKLLRCDQRSGARTMILQSPPRAAGASKPHRHSCSEEAFNLGPPMQFDRGQRIETGGFMMHPAGSVHGTDIALPDGYTLLVHTPAKAVIEPLGGEQGEAWQGPEPQIIAGPSQYRWEPHPGALGPGAVMARMSLDEGTGKGSYLLKLPSGGECDLSHGGRALELFVLNGAMRAVGFGRVEAEGFAHGHPSMVEAEAVTLAIVRLC